MKQVLLFSLISFILISGCALIEDNKVESRKSYTQEKHQKSLTSSQGYGLGPLCSGSEECDKYCSVKSLDCEEYCIEHQENKMCQERFSFVFSMKIDATLAPGYAKCYPTRGHDNYRTDKTLIIDPTNPNTMYVFVEYKGVYKSVDGGITWKPRSKGIRGSRREDDRNKACHGEYFSMAIDPTNPQRLLLVGGSGPGFLNSTYGIGGLHESTDGGESWHQLAHDWMPAYSLVAIIDPEKSSTIYYTTGAFSGTPGVDALPDPDRFLVTKGIIYKTTDNGQTWEELPTGFVPQLRGTHLFINPDNSNHLVLMGVALSAGNQPNKTTEKEQLGILFTNDGGKTWNQLTSLPEQYRAIGNADIAPAKFAHIFVNSGVRGAPEKSVYSLDGGKTFRETIIPINFARYDPHDGSGMRLIGYNIFPWEITGKNIMESTDGGATWHVLGPWPKEVQEETVPVPDVYIKDPQKVRMSNIVFHPIDPATIYLTGNFGYIWKSTDNGKSWAIVLNVDKLSDAE